MGDRPDLLPGRPPAGLRVWPSLGDEARASARGPRPRGRGRRGVRPPRGGSGRLGDAPRCVPPSRAESPGHPDDHHGPCGVHAHGDNTPLLGVVRSGARRRDARGSRPILAVRGEQRGIAGRAARLPLPHRARARARVAARCLDGRHRRVRPARGGRCVPCARDRGHRPPTSRGSRSPQRGGPGSASQPGQQPTAHAMVRPRGDPGRPPDRGHELHRHRPGERAPPVDRTTRDLPRVVCRRLLGPRGPPRPLGHRARSGRRDTPLGSARVGGRLADPAARDGRAGRVCRGRHCPARPPRRRPPGRAPPDGVLRGARDRRRQCRGISWPWSPRRSSRTSGSTRC